MPGKHVHFNSVLSEYSPMPNTPSPAFSYTSLPSSSGPPTPPNYPSYLPATGATQIHPMLAGPSTALPGIRFDVSRPAAHACMNTKPLLPIPPANLAEPATHPPLPSLRIICDALPWPITIAASNPKMGVSCRDVFDGVYRTLRVPVTHGEFGTLSAEAGHRVSTAFHSRVQREGTPQKRDEELRKGLKRIDFLMSRNRFVGLTSTKAGPETWALNVQ